MVASFAALQNEKLPMMPFFLTVQSSNLFS
jgi:hypothetical protein